MSFEPRDHLRHILVEADYLIDRSAGVPFDVFLADETLRRAFVRSLEIIGEAAKKITLNCARAAKRLSSIRLAR